jgi:hypothetical protein
MNEQEMTVHRIAFEVAHRVEALLAIPKGKRALRFFELYQLVRTGLTEYGRLSERHHDQLAVGDN